VANLPAKALMVLAQIRSEMTAAAVSDCGAVIPERSSMTGESAKPLGSEERKRDERRPTPMRGARRMPMGFQRMCQRHDSGWGGGGR